MFNKGEFLPRALIAEGTRSASSQVAANPPAKTNSLKLDILTANDVGSISLFLGNGDGTLIPPVAPESCLPP
jgi:hypothetical protein